MSRAEIKWAYDKWCEGYTKKEIAAALFVNPSTIKDALRGRVKKSGRRSSTILNGKGGNAHEGAPCPFE